jgi:deoxyribodipyrimidine photo-lyase
MTGIPIIDALMREMNFTGFMPNRGRMVVASYFAMDLK